MAQRLASSRSPTKYASAASCRVKMAHTWKCMSYLLSSRAISQTKHEKGNLQIRRSVLFWNHQILQRATVPSQYLWGFFTFPAQRNSFWGALPPMVGQSFLLADSSPPYVDGLASAAIWTNCQIGNDSSNLPTSPNFSGSFTLLSNSLWVGACSTSGTGGSTGTGGACSVCNSALVQTWRALLPYPILGVFLVLAILEFERVSQPEARVVLQESCDSHCEF